MLSFAKLSKDVLLVGSLVLSAQLPAWAEPASPTQSAKPSAKPSKPLNLAGFTKPRTAPHRLPARPEPSPATPQPEPPLTTATVPKLSPGAAEPAAADPRESDTAQFCKNIADAALDARVAWQQKELEAAEAKLRQRIAELEAKRAEYEQWLKRREVFLARAEDSVVKIYAGMKPDAAAERLAMVNVDLAAAILLKLDPRKAGVILNEMDQKSAAALTGIMASAARRVDPS